MNSAVNMITLTPAKLIGLETKGKLDVNCDADIVIFDEDINIEKTIYKGHII